MTAGKRPSKEDLRQLLQVLNSIHPVGKGVEQYLLKKFYCLHIPKGKYFLRSGEICDSILFINKGMMRSFILEDDKEVTTRFGIENELVTILSSFIMHTPTIENIQAIEDCELLVLSSDDLNKMYRLYPSFNAVGRRMMELYYIYAEKRAYITRLRDAEKKYELFLEYFSPYANRMQLTHTASFLGITIETLSRVRAKASSRKKIQK
jgi:CRP-like cAMP-binding protein